MTEPTFTKLVTDEDNDTESNSCVDSSISTLSSSYSVSESDDRKSSSNPVASFEY